MSSRVIRPPPKTTSSNTSTAKQLPWDQKSVLQARDCLRKRGEYKKQLSLLGIAKLLVYINADL